MTSDKLPHMKSKGQDPIKYFQVNDSTILAIYPGSLSKLDILIKYRQKNKTTGKWSNIRTPKHIHWVVDILLKMQSYRQLTRKFIDYFISIWVKTKPLKTVSERQALDLQYILQLSKQEIRRFRVLSKHGEYSICFLILLAKLLMLQEKTNYPGAYMFKRVLDGLKSNKDLFSLLATATMRGR